MLLRGSGGCTGIPEGEGGSHHMQLRVLEVAVRGGHRALADLAVSAQPGLAHVPAVRVVAHESHSGGILREDACPHRIPGQCGEGRRANPAMTSITLVCTYADLTR